MCPGVDSDSKKEYQAIPGGKDGQCIRVTTLGKDGQCIKVTTLPPLCAECLEILEP
jgi:hypothetical protein